MFLKHKIPTLGKVRNRFCSDARALQRSRRVSLTQLSTTSRLNGVPCDTAAKFSGTTGSCLAANREAHTHIHQPCDVSTVSTVS